MSSSPYASALGRIKAHLPEFLTKEYLQRLLGAKDIGEVTKLLEPTPYGPELVQAAASYAGAPLLEVAINRLLIRRNRHAYESATFAGRPIVGAYLRRWDIENLELILSAKAQGRGVSETDAFLISSRELPAGLIAGTLTLDDVRQLLAQPTLEATVSAAVRFGYGTTLLPLLEAYQRTHDIFPLVQVLEREYYHQLIEALRFFQGDEWVVRQFLQEEIDGRNILLLLKARDGGLPSEPVLDRWIDGGTLSRAAAADAAAARDVPEVVKGLEGRFPALMQGLSAYQQTHSLTGFDSALSRERAARQLRRMRSYPLSLSVLFTYLQLAELERGDLRRIIYGKLYGLSADRIEPLLVLAGA
ncbi:MAG: V-type ATPase subunit [Thermoplasmata archaeon]|nr:V-type ATPase subunit [Thermoplasmata archaeon]